MMLRYLDVYSGCPDSERHAKEAIELSSCPHSGRPCSGPGRRVVLFARSPTGKRLEPPGAWPSRLSGLTSKAAAPWGRRGTAAPGWRDPGSYAVCPQQPLPTARSAMLSLGSAGLAGATAGLPSSARTAPCAPDSLLGGPTCGRSRLLSCSVRALEEACQRVDLARAEECWRWDAGGGEEQCQPKASGIHDACPPHPPRPKLSTCTRARCSTRYWRRSRIADLGTRMPWI